MWTLLAFAAGALAVAAARAGTFPSDVEDALDSSKNLYVATTRADGTKSSVKPIWFMYDGDAVYFTTVPDSYKAKRVRQGRPLHVWVGAEDGPYFVGTGEIVTDPDVAARMAPVYNEKYWISWLGFFRPRPERVQEGKTVIVKVTPAAGG